MRNWLNFTEVEVLMIKIIASVSVSPAPPSNSSAVSHSSQLPKANMCQVTRSPALHSPPLPFKVLLQEQKIKRGCDKSGDHAVLIRLPDLTFSIYHWLGSPPCHEWDSTMPTWVTSSFYLLIVWNSVMSSEYFPLVSTAKGNQVTFPLYKPVIGNISRQKRQQVQN